MKALVLFLYAENALLLISFILDFAALHFYCTFSENQVYYRKQRDIRRKENLLWGMRRKKYQ